ncbi:MAG: hypothetical protein IKN38_10880 [Clostridia bacterium]|nr:hypothetical protein [Clostridia bacterium]
MDVGSKTNAACTDTFSLLFPEGSSRGNYMKKSAEALSSLGLSDMFDMKSADVTEYLSCDADVIAYRQKTVRDVMNVPGALSALKKCVPIMRDIADIRKMGSDADTTDAYIYNMTEVELYVSLLELLSDDILPLKERFESDAMKTFCDKVEELTQSERYKEINKMLEELTYRVREIKSVALGVNLDAGLYPESAGLISVGSGKYSMAEGLEKIFRIDAKRGEERVIAPLVKAAASFTDPEEEGMRRAVLAALSTIFKSSFKSWRKIVQTYVLENTAFIMGVIPEIEFLSLAGAFLDDIASRGIETAFPKVIGDGAHLAAKGLVNPIIALKTADKMVPNDVDFGEYRIFVITGPNRGGKSVFTCAVGQAVMMASLGLPVAAEEFEMSCVDNLFCHFPTGEDDTVEKGRLGEECARLSQIVSSVTEKSLVLLDESLSSTGSDEASSIAEQLLEGLAVIGCRAVFSTHLHALALGVDEINRASAALGGAKIDNMVAKIAQGERSFRIVRAKPEGKSYAKDIAEKYGLSLDSILKKAGIFKNDGGNQKNQ